jgi:3-oxoacyl-[acyl-carrier protein] reductase
VEVYLAGRTNANVDAVAARIAAAGGRAHSHAVDAMNDTAVNEYIDRVVKQAGGLYVAFNAVGPLAGEYGNTESAVELPIEEYMVPLTAVVKSRFITARAAARHSTFSPALWPATTPVSIWGWRW